MPVSRYVRALALSALAFLAVPAVASRQVDELVRGYMEATHAPGMSVAVVRDGRVVYAKGFGYADLEHRVKANDRTLFEIGSVTKQFCAVAILMLVQEGALSLDDKVGRHLENAPEAWKEVTIRQMLSHTAGLREYLGVGFNLRRDYSRMELFDFIAGMKMDFEPGAAWSYSNAGYVLAGMILEKISGKKWEEFVRERIFQPLGMADAQLIAPARVLPNLAEGYGWNNREWSNAEPMRPMAAFACGDIVLHARDFARWAAAMDTGALLKPESFRELWAPARLNTGRTHPYSLGWFHEWANASPNVHHGGNTYGFSAAISRFPEQNLSVVLLSNLAGQAHVGLARLIAATYFAELEMQAPKVAPDPDRALTFRLIGAIRMMLNGRADSPDMAPELAAMLRSMRGRLGATALRHALGQIRTLRFSSRREVDGVWIATYIGVFEKETVALELAVTKEGQLVRFAPTGPARLTVLGEP